MKFNFAVAVSIFILLSCLEVLARPKDCENGPYWKEVNPEDHSLEDAYFSAKEALTQCSNVNAFRTEITKGSIQECIIGSTNYKLSYDFYNGSHSNFGILNCKAELSRPVTLGKVVAEGQYDDDIPFSVVNRVCECNSQNVQCD